MVRISARAAALRWWAAGIAGLTAAYELLRAGFDVTVFEASSRYGGRSLTVRPSAPDYKAWYLKNNPFVQAESYYDTIPAEVRRAKNPEQVCAFVPAKLADGNFFELYLNAGPGRIPTHHTGVLHYCRAFGVPLEPYIFVSEANRMQAPGLNDDEPVQIRQFGYNMQAYVSEMLYALGDQALPGRGPEHQKAVEMLRKFLVQFGNLGPDGQFDLLGVEHLARGGYLVEPGAGTNDGVPRLALSIEEILEAQTMWDGLVGSDNYEWQASLLQPSGGMDMVWQAFLAQTVGGKKVLDEVRLSHEVTGMSYGNGVRPLTVFYKGPDSLAGSDAFDYAIVTSLPVYTAQIDFNGILAATVAAHLKSVLYMNGGKYGWQGKTRFWEEPGTQIFGGISWTAHQIEQIWYPSDGYNGPTGVLTGGYLHDANPVGIDGKVYTSDTDYRIPKKPLEIESSELNASRWAEMSQTKRTEQALIGGNALHAGFADKVYADKGMSVSWENQPYQYGIGVYDMPGSRPAAYQRLIYPIDHHDRVYLAGDYLSYWSGWQEGSVRSVWWALGLMKDRIAAEKK